MKTTTAAASAIVATAILCASLQLVHGFAPAVVPRNAAHITSLSSSPGDAWSGDVVQGGDIRGCSLQAVGEQPITEWIVKIDGVEADLGGFSEVIYKKITSDAKQQRFQGFRPGTIPPHLQPTYRAFTMDECARETVMEAMAQNNVRTFTDARTDMTVESVSIPPLAAKKGRKKGGRKNKGGKKNKKVATPEFSGFDAVSDQLDGITREAEPEPAVEVVPQWRTFDTMQEAIDAGWKPGQSFSFVAKNVRGQMVKGDKDLTTERPLGLNY
uniref:Trigger factor ribosome-binding bacterial domain-containing protein n=1 Tax=Craspedostauros australis TaxID=1486917 RepID=A0A7R9WSK8_9STRA